jgi:hypothetical protein
MPICEGVTKPSPSYHYKLPKMVRRMEPEVYSSKDKIYRVKESWDWRQEKVPILTDVKIGEDRIVALFHQMQLASSKKSLCVMSQLFSLQIALLLQYDPDLQLNDYPERPWTHILTPGAAVVLAERKSLWD